MPEIRVDPLTGLRTIIAADRADRPGGGLSCTAPDPIDPEKDLAALLPGAKPEALDTLRARLTARGATYTVRTLAGVGDLQRAAEATLFAPAGASAEVTAWRPLRP